MLTFIKKQKILIILAVLIIIVAVVAVKARSNGNVETALPVVSDLVRTVSIAGKVVPSQSVSLSFETVGIVSGIEKGVGETVTRGSVIARLDATTVVSEINKAEAELALAQSELTKLNGAGEFEAQIVNAKRGLIQSMVEAYTAADDAVYNKTDQLFIDPISSRPELSYSMKGNFDLRDSILEQRVEMTDILNNWKVLLQGLNSSTYSGEKLTQAKSYLTAVTNYISDVARAVNTYEDNTTITQATIDAYKADVLTARETLNNVSNNIISSEDNLNSLLLDVPVQVARVESARATLANNRSQLSRTVISSPITGVVSKQDAKVGQVVSANSELVSVISTDLEIEVYIPEILISGVKVDDPTTITLDAYGTDQEFGAKVTHIDPAETIRDGVSTYKVKLAFISRDERVRSGMTANALIETFRKRDATLIPQRAVVREDEDAYVYVLNTSNKEVRMNVETGEADSRGNVEVLSEIPLDAKIIINPVSN